MIHKYKVHKYKVHKYKVHKYKLRALFIYVACNGGIESFDSPQKDVH